MSKINNPQTVWIQGRCHRINATTDKEKMNFPGEQLHSNLQHPVLREQQLDQEKDPSLGAYVEPDLYGEDDREFENIQMINNKFVSTVPLPTVFHSRLIGAKGAVKKRLEYETKCQVNIPRMHIDGPVEVVGLTRDDVISCLQRIDTIIKSARMKMRPTHFIGVPFEGESLLGKFKEFTDSLDKYSMPGYTPDMLTTPQKLHVTFNVMALLDDNDKRKAIHLLQDFIAAQKEDLFKNIEVKIKGLESFQANLKKCYVLYAAVHSEALQQLGDRLYSHFMKHDLSFKEHGRETVKLHMTLIKGTKGQSFDCEQMFNELREFDFGTAIVKEVHLSQMSSVDPDTGYYKASSVAIL